MTFWNLMLRMLPLAIGGAMSPMVLILQLMLLSREKTSLARSWLYVGGNLLVVIAWAVAGRSLGRHLLVSAVSSDPDLAYVEAALSLILLSLAIRTIRSSPSTVMHQSQPANVTLQSAFGLGILTMAVNLTTLVLFLPAAQDVGRSGLAPELGLLAFVLLVMITLVPAWAPPLLVMVSGDKGVRALKRLQGFVTRHHRGINFSVELVFSVVLAVRGFSAL